MTLTALPAFTDNYIWMLDDGHQALVVDPGDSAPVLAAHGARQLVLAEILVTHHHADHVGGVEALLPHLDGPVYGPKRERIPEPFVPLTRAEPVDVLGLCFDVIDVPGKAHVCCAHEYTLPNHKLVRAVEPANAALAAYTAWCESRCAKGMPTLPSSIARERQVNPFLRCGAPAVANSARDHGATSNDAVAVLAARREWKNGFR